MAKRMTDIELRNIRTLAESCARGYEIPLLDEIDALRAELSRLEKENGALLKYLEDESGDNWRIRQFLNRLRGEGGKG